MNGKKASVNVRLKYFHSIDGKRYKSCLLVVRMNTAT